MNYSALPGFNPVVIPQMQYGVSEIPGVNPYKLGGDISNVYAFDKFGPEPNPEIFQTFLNQQPIYLDPSKLNIPEPSRQLKSRPGYTPTILPKLRDDMILRGYFGVT